MIPRHLMIGIAAMLAVGAGMSFYALRCEAGSPRPRRPPNTLTRFRLRCRDPRASDALRRL